MKKPSKTKDPFALWEAAVRAHEEAKSQVEWAKAREKVALGERRETWARYIDREFEKAR